MATFYNKLPMTLSELDEYMKSQGIELVVTSMAVNMDVHTKSHSMVVDITCVDHAYQREQDITEEEYNFNQSGEALD